MNATQDYIRDYMSEPVIEPAGAALLIIDMQYATGSRQGALGRRSGRGVVGIFTRDIAETKAARVTELAELNGMPLLCTTEPED